MSRITLFFAMLSTSARAKFDRALLSEEDHRASRAYGGSCQEGGARDKDFGRFLQADRAVQERESRGMDSFDFHNR